LYLIKWNAKELKKINDRENELRNQEMERLQNENENLNKANTEHTE
jgi:hypothetical protein